MKSVARIAAGAAIGALATGFLLPFVSEAQPNNEDTYRQLDLFATVLERVRADYVEEISDEKLIAAALNGMLSSLDPHSDYLTPEHHKDMEVQTKGEFGGLGIEVSMENGLVKVVSPIDDTPAYRAGVEAGDLITHLDGDPILGLTLAEAVKKMRGPVDSKLVLTIRREGEEPFDLTIVRGVINIQSVRHRTEGDIGYIRITSFNEKTSDGVQEAMDAFKEELGENLKGIVLDLRNNPGGLLKQAIEVSDEFLERGEIVSTRGRNKDDAQRFNARQGDLADGLPIVVLINSGSASASEIVAGALQDHGRAIVMGTDSFGKGSVQTIIPLGNNGSIRLTTARYYTPSGRSIQAKGISPDIEVRTARIETIDETNRRRESDLRGRLDNPDGDAPESDASAAEETPKAPATPPAAKGDAKDTSEAAPQRRSNQALEDYQLSRALDLLRGLALYRTKVVN